MILFLVIILALFTVWPSLDGRQFYEAYIGLIFLMTAMSYELFKKIHWSVGVAFGIMAVASFNAFFFPMISPIPIDPLYYVRGGAEILYAFTTLVLFAFLLYSHKEQFFLKLF